MRCASLAILLLACAPGTTRPPFRPYPEALTAVVNAVPARVTAEIAAWLAAEGLQVQWASPQDGYVETAWFDTRTRQSFTGSRDLPDLDTTVKIRCWSDPYIPGTTRLTVEAVYRPLYDPSRYLRDLEVPVPVGHDGHRLTERLLEALREKFGSS